MTHQSSVWQTIIGLEIHVQLKTRSMLFSSAPNQFGDEPNTNLDFLNSGQGGSLPILNKKAVDMVIALGLGINAKINPISVFCRKNYLYPDSPLGYQISQSSQPILTNGFLIADVGEKKMKKFYIHQAHLESDAGKLMHFPECTVIDFNRCQVPLLEIISEPCIFSGEEAVAYGKWLKLLLEYLEISDCNMQEGHFRMDVNLSVRKNGESELRPKCEIKNMNSFSYMQKAIEAEKERQINFYHLHPQQLIPSKTLRFDPENEKIYDMRTKETCDDYRYFPEPDLPKLFIHPEQIQKIKENLPELPQDRLQRYCNLGLSEDFINLLIYNKALCDYFEQGLPKAKNAKSFCSWVVVEFLGRTKDRSKRLQDIGILAIHIAELSNLVEENIITGKLAKSVADEMMNHPGLSPKEIVENNLDYQPITDIQSIASMIEEICNNHSDFIQSHKNDNTKMLQFFMGKVMQQSHGKASPQMTKELLLKKLKEKLQDE